MKKLLCLLMVTISVPCLGMGLFSAVIDYLVTPTDTEVSSHSYERRVQPRIKHWLYYLENRKFDKAIAHLKKYPSQGAHSFLLAQCVQFELPIIQLKELIHADWLNLSNENFINGITMAVRTGDLKRYKVLKETCRLNSMELLDLATSCRILAAGGRYEFVEWFIEYAEIVKDRIQKEGSTSSQYSEDRETGEQDSVEADELSFVDKMWLNFSDLSLRCTDPIIILLASSGKRRLKERGTKEHSLPLHAAVDTESTKAIVLLLRNGAHPKDVDHDGDTALSIAKRNKFKKIAKLLKFFCKWRDSIHNYNPEDDASDSSDNLTFSQILCTCPALASRYIRDSEGNTLLHKAVTLNDASFAQLLLRLEPKLQNEANNAGKVPDLSVLGSIRIPPQISIITSHSHEC